MSKKIYFDNGSTSFPKAPGVAEAMSELLLRGAFNINRGNYEGAYEVAEVVLETRELLAELFGAGKAKQVVFSPGITHSLNYFLKGILKPGDHILVSGMEHNAVMRPLEQLKSIGVAYEIVPADQEGSVKAEDFEKRVRPETKAIMVLHASNVCGTILPIKKIGEVCKKHDLYYGVDTAQSAGTLKIDMQECNIDFLGFTGHKGLLGPQGIGGFVISERLSEELPPLIAGGTGSQSDSFEMPQGLPDRYESGTMNLPGIIGLHAALIYLKETGIDTIHREKMELTKYFLDAVKNIPGIRVIGKQGLEDRVAVVSLDFPGHDNAMVAFELEQRYGIMTRVGLHCAPEAHRSLGTYPQGTVRFAFSASNTKEEIDICIKAFQELLLV